MEVIRRLCCPCPLAALKSPNVVGVDGYGTKPVGLRDKETERWLLITTETGFEQEEFVQATVT